MFRNFTVTIPGRCPQVFVDLDGVLADFNRYYYECFGFKLETGRNAEQPPNFWKNISKHGSFYRSLPLMPDALELWHGVKTMHPDPIILTGGVPSIKDTPRQKREWVDEFIDPEAHVIVCESKNKRDYAVAGDIIIDDWEKWRHLWEEMGGTFILHENATKSLSELAHVLEEVRA